MTIRGRRARFEGCHTVFGNPSSVHKYGQESHIVIERARIETANAINCHQEEIIFTASGTEANNIALEGFIEPEDHKLRNVRQS